MDEPAPLPSNVTERLAALERENHRLNTVIHELRIQLREKDQIILRLQTSGPGAGTLSLTTSSGGGGADKEWLRTFFQEEMLPEFLENIQQNRRGISWIRSRMPRLESSITESSQREIIPRGEYMCICTRQYLIWFTLAASFFFAIYAAGEDNIVVSEASQMFGEAGSYLKQSLVALPTASQPRPHLFSSEPTLVDPTPLHDEL